MVDAREKAPRIADPRESKGEALRQQARANFSASVKRIIDEKHFGARFAGLSDIEIMEAATEITLRT